jgi:formate hydrogenlyase regulatory protein HycA
MKFPEQIRVKRMEDYHTHNIGKYENGNQFFGYGTFVFTEMTIPENWEKYRREYAVLYLFDKDGNFKEAKYEFAGTSDLLKFDTEEKIEEFISQLGEIEYCDIEIKPFEIEIDGFKFGLIPNEESEMIELQPSNTIAFGEPWDGEYDT